MKLNTANIYEIRNNCKTSITITLTRWGDIVRIVFTNFSAIWGEWISWSNCPVDCTTHNQYRNRPCQKPISCGSAPTEYIPCKSLGCYCEFISMKLTKFIWKKCHFSIFVLVAVYDIFNTMEIKYRDCPMSKICYFHIDDHKSVVLRQTCVVRPFTIYF